jgi:glycosyltransferase involved in cell wall biosynthesis
LAHRGAQGRGDGANGLRPDSTMRVLHVIVGLWRGGEQSLTYECVRALSALGVQSEIFAYRTGREASNFAAIASTATASETGLHDLLQARQFDVVHLINGQAELGAIESLARSGRGMGIVVSYHSLTGFAPVWSRRNASLGTTVSRYLQTRLREYTDLPLCVVPNGVDVQRFSPGSAAASSERPIVGWVGRPGDPAKGFGTFLDVLEQAPLDGFQAWVADPSPQRWWPQGRERGRCRITRWETVPTPEMPEFYRAVAASGGALLSTSVSEGLPMCLLEAMACGCPVVAPAIMGIPELLNDRRTGLLYSPCAEAKEVACLVRGLEHGPLRERLVREALEGVRERFTMERMAQRYLGTYQRAVSAPLSPKLPDGTEWPAFRRWFFLYGREMRRSERQLAGRCLGGIPLFRWRQMATGCLRAAWHALRGDRWLRRQAARVAWANAGYAAEAGAAWLKRVLRGHSTWGAPLRRWGA